MENLLEQILATLQRIEARVQLQQQQECYTKQPYVLPYNCPPSNRIRPPSDSGHTEVGWFDEYSFGHTCNSGTLPPPPLNDTSPLGAPLTLTDSPLLNSSPLREPLALRNPNLDPLLHHTPLPTPRDATNLRPDEKDCHADTSAAGPCWLTARATANPALPSSEICKNKLRSVQEVLAENVKLQTESLAGTLCQKLAKEAIFGKDVMKKCTPAGSREYPALPQAELYELKKIMYSQFPRFNSCPGAFESVWKKCMVAVEQACKRLRN